MAEVRVYSTPICPNCVKAKGFLKENNIDFEEINVAEDKVSAMIMVQRTGQRTVPVVEIDGKFIVGFDKGALTHALKL